MRRIVAALVVSLSLSVSAQADADPIEQVINDQLSAFLANDFESAFSYASPSIKRLFGSPQRFGQMVREGYPMVHRPAEVRMLGQSVQAGGVEQRVLIRDQSGRLHTLSYMMIETSEGWQINGVQLLRGADVGA